VPAADDAFVPLADWLARAALPAPPPDDVAVSEPLPPAQPEPDVAELLRDVRLFRARLADALEAARDALARELAYAVLGRELLLAPADVTEIAARLIRAHPAATAVRLRVAPADVARVATIAPACEDPALVPGDVVLEFAGGEHDARLGARLASALAAWS